MFCGRLSPRRLKQNLLGDDCLIRRNNMKSLRKISAVIIAALSLLTVGCSKSNAPKQTALSPGAGMRPLWKTVYTTLAITTAATLFCATIQKRTDVLCLCAVRRAVRIRQSARPIAPLSSKMFSGFIRREISCSIFITTLKKTQ